MELLAARHDLKATDGLDVLLFAIVDVVNLRSFMLGATADEVRAWRQSGSACVSVARRTLTACAPRGGAGCRCLAPQERIIQEAFTAVAVAPHLYDTRNLVSRKKDFLPPLTRILRTDAARRGASLDDYT